MSSAAAVRTAPARRYGSVAELAAYAGLSAKTIRRLITAGAVRGLRVGRRVLVPFEDFDRHILRTQEPPTMAIAPNPTGPGTVDLATGRLLPLTDAERRARSANLARVLAELPEADKTDTDETWREVFRGIDESRPHRPLFGGMD